MKSFPELPGKSADSRLYILVFDSGTLKVGQSRNVRSRVRTHIANAKPHGVKVTMTWFSDPQPDGDAAERHLIDLAASLGEEVHGREWFYATQADHVIAEAATAYGGAIVDDCKPAEAPARKPHPLRGMEGPWSDLARVLWLLIAGEREAAPRVVETSKTRLAYRCGGISIDEVSAALEMLVGHGAIGIESVSLPCPDVGHRAGRGISVSLPVTPGVLTPDPSDMEELRATCDNWGSNPWPMIATVTAAYTMTATARGCHFDEWSPLHPRATWRGVRFYSGRDGATWTRILERLSMARLMEDRAGELWVAPRCLWNFHARFTT